MGERDELNQATDRRKYTILGRDIHGNAFYTCGKIRRFITAHQAD